MFFKIKTGNVRISFPNYPREVHCPYLTRGSAQHPFKFQRYSPTINAYKYSFFVRTVSAWNALSPQCLLFPYVLIPLLCSIQVFVIMLYVLMIFIIIIFLFHMTCNFICIYLVICFHFVYLSRCQCHELPCTDRPLPY